MQERWFRDEDYFSVLTELLRKSVGGGTITIESIEDEKLHLFEQGVEEGVISKLDHILCSNCDKTYSHDEVPEICICGYEFTEDYEVNQTEYVIYGYPDIIRTFLNDSIDGFNISYHRSDIDTISVSELHSHKHDDKFLHISPRFVIESGVHLFPGYNDIFLSWNQVPNLIESPEETIDGINEFFRSHKDGREFFEQEGVEFRPDGSGILRYDDSGQTEWFTLLHRHSKSVANERARAAFDMSYNDLFELLGIDFLNTMFPHAYTFQAGGAYKPDGYLLLNQGLYLVESKCYSDDFKLFSEEDKANRYIQDYIERIDRSPIASKNLIGYIFIAHTFNQGALPEDIKSFVRRNISDVNLDVICVNDLMMETADRELTQLYQMNPAARFRIFDKSTRYLDFLDLMADLTERHGPNEDLFSEGILTEMKRIAQEPTAEEQIIDSGFEGSSEVDPSAIDL